MKQQGFHIADRTHHAKRRADPLPGSSQTSSKLADGLQGLMDMCNAGSLMTAPVQATVCTSLPCNMKICEDLIPSCLVFLVHSEHLQLLCQSVNADAGLRWKSGGGGHHSCHSRCQASSQVCCQGPESMSGTFYHPIQ